MTLGKNKRLSKGGKKSLKKKIGDAMLGKEWYDVVAPANFQKRHCGKTVCNKSKGTFSAPEAIKGRVFQYCLADLMTQGKDGQPSDDKIHKARNVSLRCEEVQGRNILTQFNGMSMTTDALRSLLKKWVTLIEGEIEVKTSDGYTLRVFAIAFTNKMPGQKPNSPAHCKSSKVKKIRQKMYELITKSVTKNPLQSVVKLLQQETLGDEIQKACQRIFPITNVNIRKVKVVRQPKVDSGRIFEAHGGSENIPKSNEGGRQLIQEEAPPAAEVEAADD